MRPCEYFGTAISYRAKSADEGLDDFQVPRACCHVQSGAQVRVPAALLDIGPLGHQQLHHI